MLKYDCWDLFIKLSICFNKKSPNKSPMEIKENITIDMTQIMIKLCELDAHLITLNKVLLSDQQKKI